MRCKILKQFGINQGLEYFADQKLEFEGSEGSRNRNDRGGHPTRWKARCMDAFVVNFEENRRHLNLTLFNSSRRYPFCLHFPYNCLPSSHVQTLIFSASFRRTVSHHIVDSSLISIYVEVIQHPLLYKRIDITQRFSTLFFVFLEGIYLIQWVLDFSSSSIEFNEFTREFIYKKINTCSLK